VIALVKPQFEAGPDKVGKGGVVRRASVHQEVLEQVIGQAQDLGYGVRSLTMSPIRGAQGNVEFLLHLEAHSQYQTVIDIPVIVSRAWKAGNTDG
jgi:23S rRNA (cytidine1920-2'-O)/16S rRNA (cytidine1409-2'-O)-methyltransferase